MRSSTRIPLNVFFITLFLLGGTSAIASSNAHAQEAKLPKKKISKSKKATEKAKPTESMVKATGAEDQSDRAASSGETLKFNTDSTPPATDERPTMRFSDPGDAPLGQPQESFADQVPDDEGYKAYIGYPKHNIGASVSFATLASKWNYNGQDYNFTSAPMIIDVNYTLEFTPMWSVGLDFDTYSVKEPDTVTILPFTINSSTETFNDYYLKLRRCFISKYSFNRNLCLGLDLGNEAYPILKFKGSTDLYMGKVQDIIAGLNLTYKEGFGTEHYLLTLMGGYNMGTGLGNSGALTSKSNAALLGSALVSYYNRHNTFGLGVDFKSRAAKIKGKVGNNDDTWTTDSSLLGFKLAYAYTF